MEALAWMVEFAWRAGVQRIVVNGSFVTDKLEPNDVDCVLLLGPSFPHDDAAEAELLDGLPFINMELVDDEAFQQFTERTFATDRNLVQQAMSGQALHCFIATATRCWTRRPSPDERDCRRSVAR